MEQGAERRAKIAKRRVRGRVGRRAETLEERERAEPIVGEEQRKERSEEEEERGAECKAERRAGRSAERRAKRKAGRSRGSRAGGPCGSRGAGGGEGGGGMTLKRLDRKQCAKIDVTELIFSQKRVPMQPVLVGIYRGSPSPF